MFLNENQFEKPVELKNKLTSFIYKLRIFKFERIWKSMHETTSILEKHA